MANMKNAGEKIVTTSKVAHGAVAAKLTEDSSCVIFGFFISTGAPFIKKFATVNMASQWMLTGDAADIEITRMA